MENNDVSKKQELNHKEYVTKIYKSFIKRLDDIQKESQQWIGMNHEQFRNKERCNNG